MTRRRPWRLVLIGVTALVVTSLLAVTAVATTAVRRPFPAAAGVRDVSGLDTEVTVLRDARGVPSIYADTAEDLFRAQGYVHAQDRFFEMDWRRHVTAGRLSELVGRNEDALRADTVVRTLGWRRVAAVEVAQADPTTRSYLDAYAEGVNEYISSRTPAQLSLQYALLGLTVPLDRVEPWTPEDSVAWFKAMAWDLRGNYDAELTRARVFGTVKDVGRVEQLFPAYPYAEHAPILDAGEVRTGLPGRSGADGRATVDGPEPTNGATAAAGHARATDVTRALTGPVAARAVEAARRAVESVPDLLGDREGTGSNSWVVSGRLTASGKPLLANDPHLAPSLPGVWYQAGLHCRQVSARCPFDVAGFTFAGVPGVVIGHTGTTAWGMTNLGADVTDFYLERVRGDTAERDGRFEPMTVRTETIKVAGASPVTVRVRSTTHGPLLSDVLDPVAEVARAAPAPGGAADRTGWAVSLAWTALTPGQSMAAVFAVNTARDFDSFRRAALLLDVPAQNLVYADNLGADGHIGYQAPGRFPVRARVPAGRVEAGSQVAPTDGSWPLPGWDSRYDWRGWVDQAALPWTMDPKDGTIVAANQAVTPAGGRVAFTTDFDDGWRAERIRDLVADRTASGRLLTVSDMAAVQLDTVNPMWDRLRPLLLAADVDAFTEAGRGLLRGWDGSQPAGSAAAAYFNTVWATLLGLTFDDELPDGTQPDGGARWARVVSDLLDRPRDRWWDDRLTPDVVETRDEIVRRSLLEARLRLTREQGKDPALWRWGVGHRVALAATPTGQVSATTLLHPLLNADPVELDGGPAIVNAMSYDAATGSFDVVSAPSMRMVVDLGDVDRSRWVNQTGQSGHPGHPHYTDQLDAWADGETFGWPFGAAAVRAAAVDTLTLVPPT